MNFCQNLELEQLRLEEMEGVDTVLALLRGVHDMDVLIEVAGILVDIADLEGDCRRILRAISNFINSDDFGILGDVAVEVMNNIQDRLNAHLMALFPLSGQPPPDQEPGLGNAGDQGLN